MTILRGIGLASRLVLAEELVVVGEHERGAEALALTRSVERETCDQHRGYLTRAATAESARNLLALRQMRVVSDHHSVAVMPDERAPSPPGLGGKGLLVQPAIDFIKSARKRVEAMRLALVRQQGYRRTERRAMARARASAGSGGGGSSSAVNICSK